MRKFGNPRKWSNYELRKFASLFTGKVLNVSAGTNIDKQGSTYDKYFSSASEFWVTNYPGDLVKGLQSLPNEIPFDLESEVPKEHQRAYDVVFNHTTLEHVFDIFTAFRNLCSFSKDIVILVVPFAQLEHKGKYFSDYWRFTPSGLRELFKRNGFETLYESETNTEGAPVYLFFIASRTPEKWKNKISVTRLKGCARWLNVKKFV